MFRISALRRAERVMWMVGRGEEKWVGGREGGQE